MYCSQPAHGEARPLAHRVGRFYAVLVCLGMFPGQHAHRAGHGRLRGDALLDQRHHILGQRALARHDARELLLNEG
jgi:hypothetical protein